MALTWAYGITTVSERFGTTLPTTIRSLDAAGFPEPRLFIDGVCLPGNELQDRYWISQRVPRIGLAANWSLSMVELYVRNPNADRFAIFQDDLIAVKNLRQYVESCSYPEHGYLNLFTFLDNESKTGSDKAIGWIESALLAGSKGRVYHGKRQQGGRGALALVFNRDAVVTLFTQVHFVKRPQSGEAGQKKIDGGIVESMNQAGWREYVHNPSLIAHRGTVSTKPGSRWTENARSFPGDMFNAMDMFK